LDYLALRNFYETEEASQVTFHMEFGEGRIDIVLSGGGQECAFELKRWQEDNKPILCKDYDNLKNFANGAANRQGYELVFTVNDNRDITERHKGAHFDQCFADKLSKKYTQVCKKVMEFDTFTVCVYLAAPNAA
jgi:hypothetical protein